MKLLMSNRKLESESEKLRIKSEECKFKKVDVETTNLKCERAITLITLVLTIIILIILAGVVINLSIGENGLFSKAKKAREDYMAAVNSEQQELANIDIDKLAGEQTNIWEPEIVTAKDIANKTDKSNYYGATVTNYTCTNGEGVNDWKIFYSDENNIYLIADDYVYYEYLPQPIILNDSWGYDIKGYAVEFGKVYDEYIGSEDIKDSKIQYLNKQYFEYLTKNNKTDTSKAIKAVAFMLDVNSWNGFTGEKAEYAIGGPTIEMFLASYMQTHSEIDYRIRVREEDNIIGYEISIDDGVNWDYEVGGINVNDKKYGKLYTVNNNKAWHMFLASPSVGCGNDYIMTIISSNISIDTPYDGDAGFRPLVCLKSDVQLESQKDGTYKIK